ncbi:flagellar biosynthesis protein FlhB [Kushneria aurantia]|uniref:Flagellar biosynthetic protein FlhB n=1 Tax=Kushneria aurantia TaxID=504092 RepID=A0ABV6G101_9GAMM|nr:flagellar biosynthesis protein FlhB [Kushneria aurantia]
MADDSDEEKTEEPTARRLEKAREEGQIARSRELTTFMMLMVGIGGLWLTMSWMGDHLGRIMSSSMSFETAVARDPQVMMIHVFEVARQALLAIAPILGIMTLIALFAPMALGGWLFSTKSLKFDAKRLNPLSGFKRLFSSQILAELAKTIAKSILIGLIAAIYLYYQQGALLGLANENIQTAIQHALMMVLTCCALIMLSFIVVILIDVPYQLWSHTKKLRMSRHDIKQEHKESEGDPQVKGRIRQQQQAAARQRMMSQVPDADVIITNPTHFAVALVYREDQMGAPRVVAKGADKVAGRIRELGREHRVPFLEAPALARSLYRFGDLDQEIPAQLYTAVAEVLAWVFQLKRFRSEGGWVPTAPSDIEVPPEMAYAPQQTASRDGPPP